MGLDGLRASEPLWESSGEAVGILWGGSGEASQPPGRLLLKAISMRFGGVLLEALGNVLGGALGDLLGASWKSLRCILEALGGVVGGFRTQNWSRTSSWTVSVFRENRLGVVF